MSWLTGRAWASWCDLARPGESVQAAFLRRARAGRRLARRRRLAAVLWWVERGLWVEVRWWCQSAGYWVRPYDMLADRRRWRWQTRQRCGWSMWR